MTLTNKPLNSENTIRLGLGTGSLGTILNYKKSCSLIEKAYEAGFRHFDTAPSYGRGLSESIVGDVLSSVRDTVTIVTKVGIPHPRAGGAIRLARKILLPLKTAFPSLWKMGQSRTMSVAVPASKFAQNDIESSFAESLRRLRTDYVDGLLLHEIQTQEWNDDLNSLICEFRNNGSAREIGIGTTVEASVELLKQHPTTIDLVQVPHYSGAFESTLNAGKHKLITHQCLTGAWDILESEEVRTRLTGNNSTRALQDALSSSDHGANLLIASGLLQNPNGIVLISTCRPERLESLVNIANTYKSYELAPDLNQLFSNLSE